MRPFVFRESDHVFVPRSPERIKFIYIYIYIHVIIYVHVYTHIYTHFVFRSFIIRIPYEYHPLVCVYMYVCTYIYICMYIYI